MNTALVYFADDSLRDEYCREAVEFMKNVKVKPDSIYAGIPYMLFAEQRLLPMIARKRDVKADCFADLDWLFTPGNQIFTHVWGAKQGLRDNPDKCREFCIDCVRRIEYEFPKAFELLSQLPWLQKYLEQ